MNIDKKIMEDYLKKVSLNTAIITLNLDFKEDGVETNVMDASNTAMVIGKLKKEAFSEYTSIGEIFIKDTRMLTEALKTFDDKISLEKVGDNVLKLYNDNREVNLMLAEEKICDNVYRKEKPVIATTVSVDVQKHILTRTLNDMKLLNVGNVTFKKEGDKLFLNVGNEQEYDFIKNVTSVAGEGDVTVSVAASFKETVTAASENVTLHLGHDLPVVVEDKTEFIETETFISPFVKFSD